MNYLAILNNVMIFFLIVSIFFHRFLCIAGLKVAITGGIGCGKSTVLKYLEANGVACMSADAVVRRRLSEDRAVIESVVGHFGEAVENEEGSVDRRALAKIVFESKSELEWLESLLHPLVREECEAFFKVHSAEPACVEIPLLFEKRLEKDYDLVVSVICTDANANNRLRDKGYSETDIAFRRQQQLPNSIKAERSNMVLINDGSLKFLEQQMTTLLSYLKQHAV
jgi:dephospho-CoA kinase